MLWQKVDSTELRAIGYDLADSLLEAEFHSGEIYRYFGVPAQIVLALLEAKSLGRYFNAHIRSKFRFEKLQ